MNLETIEGLLQAFDDAIDKREKECHNHHL